MAVICKTCGNSMNDDARFCSVCGTQASVPQTPHVYTSNPNVVYAPPTRLVRPRFGRMIAGVCQGMANNYAWDVTWVRVITVLLAIFGGGIGLVAYLVFWVVMPEEPLALPQPGVAPSRTN